MLANIWIVDVTSERLGGKVNGNNWTSFRDPDEKSAL